MVDMVNDMVENMVDMVDDKVDGEHGVRQSGQHGG